MHNIKNLLIFTITLVIVSGIYVLFAPHQGPIPHSSWRHGVGEVAGGSLSWLFVIIYGRTLIKLLVKNGPLMERLLPEPTVIETTSLLKKLSQFLNNTHPYVGTMATILVFGHALIEGLSRANLLLEAVFILSLWQFAFGIFLLCHYNAVFVKKMKRYGYMAHSQLYTGIALGIFVLFGHLTFGD